MSDLGMVEMTAVEPQVKTQTKTKAEPKTKVDVEAQPLWMVYTIRENATIPTLATEFSAAYDLSACLTPKTFVATYLSDNELRQKEVIQDPACENKHGVWINPGERILIPTGLKFLINPNYYVTIYCRSGISVKQGLTLINKVGVIDADYHGEVMITLVNESKVRTFIHDGMRLCQAILCNRFMTALELPVSDVVPEKTTSRQGGFGSTGTQPRRTK